MHDPTHRGNDADAGSPLAATSYDFWRGDHDLARFVQSDVDAAIESFVRAFRNSSAAERRALRGRLSTDDFYTLLTFAGRCAVRSLRTGNPQIAQNGVNAVAVVDPERVDERDIPRSLAPAMWVLDQADAQFGDLGEWGYMAINTPHGPGFVDMSIDPYDPSVDLVRIALQVADIVDADHYTVSSITAGVDLPTVWLPGAPFDTPIRVDGLRGVVNVNARLKPDVHNDAEAQQFTVFVAEAATHADAMSLHGWALVAGTHAAVSIVNGSLLCVAIARSFVADVAGYETTEAMARFEEPFAAALVSASE